MNELRPGQLLRFNQRLMESAPKEFKPHYFPIREKSKLPDVKTSWKSKHNRLTIAEACRRMKKGIGNVGIAAKPDDQLLLLDIDDPEIIDEVKPTLTVRSRSRGSDEKPAIHAIYWADPEDEKLPANIPTDKGELRSSDQYVVAPGSYVPITDEELEDKVEEGELTEEEAEEIKNDEFRGFYTIENDREIAALKFEELPQAFKDRYGISKQTQKEYSDREVNYKNFDMENASSLYKLRMTDIFPNKPLDERFSHPIHDSSTGKNFMLSKTETDQGHEIVVGHCWRHMVYFHPIDYLCMESGDFSCQDAGRPHKKSNAGPGIAERDKDQAVWTAWYHAKKEGYIPEDDKIPVRAMKHIARKHGIFDAQEGEKLPKKAYNNVIRTVEQGY